MNFTLGDYVYVTNFSNGELVRSHPAVKNFEDGVLKSYNSGKKAKSNVMLYKIVGINKCEILPLNGYYVTDGRVLLEIRTPNFLKYASDVNAKSELEDFING